MISLTFLKICFLFNYAHVCLSVFRCLGVLGKRNLVLCKSNTCSSLLSHLSSPTILLSFVLLWRAEVQVYVPGCMEGRPHADRKHPLYHFLPPFKTQFLTVWGHSLTSEPWGLFFPALGYRCVLPGLAFSTIGDLNPGPHMCSTRTSPFWVIPSSLVLWFHFL